MHTILIADDSVTIQQAVEIVFHKEPFSVVKVGSAAEAIARARDLHAALVLADHQMPDKSGYDVAEALRADPATAQIPVLILTSAAAPYDEARGRAVGAVGNIQKPFDCQSLLDRVRALLGVAAGAAVPATLPVTGAAPMSAAVAATPRPPGLGVPPPAGGLPRPPGAAPVVPAIFPRPATTSPAAAQPMAAQPMAAHQPLGAVSVPLARAATPMPEKNVDPFGFGATMGSARPSAANPFANPPAAAQVPAASPAIRPSTPPFASAPAAAPLDNFGASPFTTRPAPPAAAPLNATASAARPEPSFDISFDDAPAKPQPVAAPSVGGSWSSVAEPSLVPATSPPRPAGFAEAEFLEVADVDIAEISTAPTVPPEPAPAVAPTPPMARAPTPVASSFADVGRITSKVDLQRLASLDAAAVSTVRATEIATVAVLERAVPAVQQAAARNDVAAPSREVLAAEAREIIERIAWEVVPELAETIIREELQRLLKAR